MSPPKPAAPQAHPARGWFARCGTPLAVPMQSLTLQQSPSLAPWVARPCDPRRPTSARRCISAAYRSSCSRLSASSRAASAWRASALAASRAACSCARLPPCHRSTQPRTSDHSVTTPTPVTRHFSPGNVATFEESSSAQAAPASPVRDQQASAQDA
jgi:hypothetical protein